MSRGLRTRTAGLLGVVAATVLGVSMSTTSYGASMPLATHPAVVHPFLKTLGHISTIGSTVPANGDINPYGIAMISSSAGRLVRGDVLVSNFNDAANVQGTGRTLVELSPTGKLTLFAKIGRLPTGQRCPGGVGLGTALAVLPGGWVVVGSTPAVGPSGAPSQLNPAGCLIVLNSTGKVVETWTNQTINGPWDMTASVHGGTAALFVSNALSRPAGSKGLRKSGPCDVTRIDVTLGHGVPHMKSATVVGSGFPWLVNHATFVLAPTGVAISASGTLYVVETIGNHITVIPNALSRTTPVKDRSNTLTKGGALNAPLGLLMAPNGDLIAVNGNNGIAVEISPSGHQVATATLVPNGAGSLFGLTLSLSGHGLVFVNDGKNAVQRDLAH